MNQRHQRGVSMIEVLVSLLLVTTVTFALLRFTKSALHATHHNTDRQFAIQKAISMLEELKSQVQVQGTASTVLDSFDDGTSFRTILSTDRSVTDPMASPSENVPLPGGFDEDPCL